MEQLPPHIQELYDLGVAGRDTLLAAINDWPIGEYAELHEFRKIDSEFRNKITDSMTAIRMWIHRLWAAVEQNSIYSKQNVFDLFSKLEKTVKAGGELSTVTYDVEDCMGEMLSIITSIPPGYWSNANQGKLLSSFTPNTAFILMWMNPSNQELAEIHHAIKDVCARFQILARRSDDVQTSDSITSIVLTHIANSEYIIADLTGERPNVYYEVGYAHALNKRIIFYRKAGTVLHFDLANYNIPEYTDVQHLKDLLRERLAAILGREPDAA